jgi:hypothetical protein
MPDPQLPKRLSRSPARKTRSKKSRRYVSFQATAQHDHVHMQANIPTRWLRVLVKILITLIIAFLILKLPEVWQAIQAAVTALPK